MPPLQNVRGAGSLPARVLDQDVSFKQPPVRFSRRVARFLMAQSHRRKTIFFQKSSGQDHHVILASLEPFSKKKTYSVKF
jgi:hypothetical protein